MSLTPSPAHQRRRPASLAIATLLLTLALASACSADDTSDADTPGATPTTVAQGDQRVVTARIEGIYAASASVEFDEVQILTGDEARRAAVDAGAIEEGEDLPNDYWLHDDSTATERLTVDPAATVFIYDCSAACEPVAVDLGAFLRGEVQPYGGDHAVVEITITGEMITSVVEIYLP
jgi:uncharacterized protein YuzB (UPF0349 family)